MKYQVKAAVKTKTNIGQYNLTEYALNLIDGSGQEITCTTLQKPDSAVPSGEIEGDIEDSQWGKKFKKAKKSFGGYNGGGSSKASTREHAQEMALRFVSSQIALNAIPKLSKEVLLPVIDWFENDALGGSTSQSKAISESVVNSEIPPVELYDNEGEEIDINDVPF